MDETARTGELRRKLEKDPGSRLFAQLAEELRKEGKLDEAISVARKGLERNSNYPSARLTLARALLDAGRPKEARPELEQIVKASPDNIMASRLLGETLDQLGEASAALAQFEKTLRLAPGDKLVGDRIADLKARAARGSAGAAAVVAAPAAPAAPPAAAPMPAVPAPPPALSPAPPFLPSVFADESPAPTLAPASGPATALPSVIAEELPAVTLAPAPAPVALDRDLASGTLSPGGLSAGDIQKHFDETAASSAEAAPRADADATLGFGAFEAPSAPVELPATLPPSFPPLPATPAVQELPAVVAPPEDLDPGGQTLPLTSVTLADLYLQQGLKAEASAVLSQVLKEEPENQEARSKLAAVSNELSQAARGVEPAPPAPTLAPLATPPALSAPPVPPRTKTDIRERAILSLRAFADAAEREALAQKATERGAF